MDNRENSGEHWEELKPGGFQIAWDDALFRPGTDSFLLSAYPRLKPSLRVCDLGSGTGLLGLLLLQREPSLDVTGIEIQPEAASLADRCAAANGLDAEAASELGGTSANGLDGMAVNGLDGAAASELGGAAANGLDGTAANSLDGMAANGLDGAAERGRKRRTPRAPGRLRTICGDLREVRNMLPAGGFDLVVSNPPYYEAEQGRPSGNVARRLARSGCTLSDVARAAAYLCRNGGAFCLCQKPERLTDALCLLRTAGCEPKRLRFACRKTGAAPSLFLLEGRRGGRPGLSVEPDLILYREDGSPTAELDSVYFRDAAFTA